MVISISFIAFEYLFNINAYYNLTSKRFKSVSF